MSVQCTCSYIIIFILYMLIFCFKSHTVSYLLVITKTFFSDLPKQIAEIAKYCDFFVPAIRQKQYKKG